MRAAQVDSRGRSMNRARPPSTNRDRRRVDGSVSRAQRLSRVYRAYRDGRRSVACGVLLPANGRISALRGRERCRGVCGVTRKPNSRIRRARLAASPRLATRRDATELHGEDRAKLGAIAPRRTVGRSVGRSDGRTDGRTELDLGGEGRVSANNRGLAAVRSRVRSLGDAQGPRGYFASVRALPFTRRDLKLAVNERGRSDTLEEPGRETSQGRANLTRVTRGEERRGEPSSGFRKKENWSISRASSTEEVYCCLAAVHSVSRACVCESENNPRKARRGRLIWIIQD